MLPLNAAMTSAIRSPGVRVLTGAKVPARKNSAHRKTLKDTASDSSEKCWADRARKVGCPEASKPIVAAAAAKIRQRGIVGSMPGIDAGNWDLRAMFFIYNEGANL